MSLWFPLVLSLAPAQALDVQVRVPEPTLCPSGYHEAREALEQQLSAYEEGRTFHSQLHHSLLDTRLQCLDGVIEAEDAVLIHLAYGLSAWLRDDRQRAASAFAAIQAIEPDFVLETVIRVTDPELLAFAEQDHGRDVAQVLLPLEEWATWRVDGRPANGAVPVGRAALVQLLHQDGRSRTWQMPWGGIPEEHGTPGRRPLPPVLEVAPPPVDAPPPEAVEAPAPTESSEPSPAPVPEEVAPTEPESEPAEVVSAESLVHLNLEHLRVRPYIAGGVQANSFHTHHQNEVLVGHRAGEHASIGAHIGTERWFVAIETGYVSSRGAADSDSSKGWYFGADAQDHWGRQSLAACLGAGSLDVCAGGELRLGLTADTGYAVTPGAIGQLTWWNPWPDHALLPGVRVEAGLRAPWYTTEAWVRLGLVLALDDVRRPGVSLRGRRGRRDSLG